MKPDATGAAMPAGLKRYSIFSLLRNAMSYHEGWARKWRSPDPKPAYDAIIIGGGGHGLGAAYFLAKEQFHDSKISLNQLANRCERQINISNKKLISYVWFFKTY